MNYKEQHDDDVQYKKELNISIPIPGVDYSYSVDQQ